MPLKDLKRGRCLSSSHKLILKRARPNYLAVCLVRLRPRCNRKSLNSSRRSKFTRTWFSTSWADTFNSCATSMCRSIRLTICWFSYVIIIKWTNLRCISCWLSSWVIKRIWLECSMTRRPCTGHSWKEARDLESSGIQIQQPFLVCPSNSSTQTRCCLNLSVWTKT